MRRLNQSAFTLVELLVVIAIIGILVSMLLPAIQASRESARRAMCTNQISQLILAVHDYELARGDYPMGTVNPQGPVQNLPNGHHISWLARILTYIDEPALNDNLDLSQSAYHQKNDRVRQVTIPLLMCPSSPTDQWPYSNYAGCHNDAEAPIDVNNRGVFYLNHHTTREDLKDGAAYTIFLGEKLPDDFDLGWLSGTSATLRNTGTPLNQNRIGSSGVVSPAWVYSYGPADSQWQWRDTAGEAVANAPVQPAGSANAAGDPELTPDKDGLLPHSQLGGNAAQPLAVGGFASGHATGVNFAFGDGSVRFICDDASAGLLGRLANRADGQIIDGKEL